MPPRDLDLVRRQLTDTPLRVDGFFLRRTGFIANQTVLRLGDYNVHCVPATLGLPKAQFLAVLTASELSLFDKYKGNTHILILSFDNPENNDIARFHLRVSLEDLLPVPERKNVCFLVLRFKSLSAEFLGFVGDYLDALEARHQSWEELASLSIPVSPNSPWGPGPMATLIGGEESLDVGVQAFHSKRIQLSWPVGHLPWKDRSSVSLKLTIRGKPLILEGQTDSDGMFLVEFHSEWLDTVEDSRFQLSLTQRTRAKVAR